MAEDKDLVTSIRWLSADKKNGFVNVCLKMLIKVGLAKPGEDLDADSLKTKLVFALCQMVRVENSICIDDSNNIMSLALHSDHYHPTPFLYSSYRLSCAYLIFIFGWGTWNGASYYIEVRSNEKF